MQLTGCFLHERTTLVQAVTAVGGGFWVMTPLLREDASTVLVNRGFVPGERRDPSGWRRPEGPVTVVGLMRMSEPGGGFLRANDPAGGRWFSRDVAAIAAAHRLENAAPYFVDEEAQPSAGGLPVAGLTIVAFPDNHLAYALTWYALAAMTAAALAYLDREALRRRRRPERA